MSGDSRKGICSELYNNLSLPNRQTKFVVVVFQYSLLLDNLEKRGFVYGW